MSAWAAFRDGVRRVNGAPLVLGAMVLATGAVALGLAAAHDPNGRGHLPPGEHVAQPGPLPWISMQLVGLAPPLTPSVGGGVAFVQGPAGDADLQPPRWATARTGVVWLLLWSLVGGGILARYASDERFGVGRFAAACGAHAGRLLRLALLAAAAWLVVLAVAEGLAGRLPADDGVAAAAIRLVSRLALVAPLAAATVLFDYARVRLVVEGRRSAIGAIAAATRFAYRHPRTVCGLVLLNVLALALLTSVYIALSNRAARADMHGWLVLALGQIHVVARHYLTLLVFASATALFQGAVLHADEPTASGLLWPESPEVEPLSGTEASSDRYR